MNLDKIHWEESGLHEKDSRDEIIQLESHKGASI